MSNFVFQVGDRCWITNCLNNKPVECTIIRIGHNRYGKSYVIKREDGDKTTITQSCFLYGTEEECLETTICDLDRSISHLDSQICKLENLRRDRRKELKELQTYWEQLNNE